jgi:hypothetical protein
VRSPTPCSITQKGRKTLGVHLPKRQLPALQPTAKLGGEPQLKANMFPAITGSGEILRHLV